MPSKQETGTSSLPESRLKSPSRAFLKASPPFQAIPLPVQKAPYQTANKEKKKKK